MATTSLNLECCGETETPRNPKLGWRSRDRKSGVKLFNVENPIPQEINDPHEIQKMFQRWNFVPFAGTTKKSGHSLLMWYLMLAKLSPTHASCINKKLKYAFGTKATFNRALDPEWETGEEVQEVPIQEKAVARDVFNDFISFSDGVGKFFRTIGYSYEATGNAWVEMTFSETLGVGRVHLKAHRVTHCLYVKTEPGQMRIVAVSPIWEEQYLQKHEPRYVPMYPNFDTTPDGDLKTMFHLKNGDNAWYGRPESEGADLYKYREMQDAMYLIKQAGANFTGQMIIEVEDDDPETNAAIEDEKANAVGYNSFAERFEQNYTAKADDPQSVLVTARPFGSRPMFVFQVKPNTSEKFYQVTGEISQQKILMNHGLTPRFMGVEVANGFSNDAFLDDYIMNVEPVINELRNNLTRFVNNQATVAWLELLAKPEMNQYGITFGPPIQAAIDDYRNRRNSEGMAVTQQAPKPEMI